MEATSTRPIDVVDLSGDAHDRGIAFGKIRRERITTCLFDWRDTLRGAGVSDLDAYIARFLRDTDFLTAIEVHAPDLLAEVRGIAKGAGHPFELLLAEQLMDEEWAYRPSFLGCGDRPEKCSSAAVHPRHGLTWIGQNMDLGGYTNGHQVVMRIVAHAPEHGALVFTIGGMIALMGVNARGVGVCVNSLPQLPSARKGFPVAFMIRKLLQAENLEQAAAWVRTVPHATGQHYLIADPTGIRSFEGSAAGVHEYRSPDPSRVVHTNHPLAAEKGVSYGAADQANTEARLYSLTNRLMRGEPNLEAIKAALSARDDPQYPVCREPNPNGQTSPITGMIGFTTGSMVSALEQNARTIDSWVSSGPPRLRGYTHLRLPSGL